MPLSKLRPSVTLEFAPGDMLVLLSDGIFEFCNDSDEEYGETRVAAILSEHYAKPAAELASILLAAVREFAGGRAQEDDITMVLVKRAAMQPIAGRAFARTAASLPAIFDFTAAEFARAGLPLAILTTVDFIVEELFTNMVKYSKMSEAAVDIALTGIENGVEVTLTDHDVDAFDVTAAPDADINLPIEQRKPGGLGLHLIRRMVDSIEYQYSAERRQSRITFRKSLPAGGDETGR